MEADKPTTSEVEEEQSFGVAPIPASSGTGIHDDPELKEVDKAIRSEPEEQSFGVAPIPASSGAGNPISVKPGEKLPDSSTFRSNE